MTLLLGSLVTLTSCLMLSGQENALGPNFENADRNIRYDIDINGKILKIDYIKQEAEIYGQLQLDSDEPLLVLKAWMLDGKQNVLLLALDLELLPEQYGRYYTCDLETKSCEPTSIAFNLEGDSAFLRYFPKVIIADYNEFKKTAKGGLHLTGSVNIVYNSLENRIVGHFTESLPRRNHIKWGDRGRYSSNEYFYLYVSPYGQGKIVRIDTRTGEVLRTFYMKDHAVGEVSGFRVSVMDINGAFALCFQREPGAKTRRLFIYDLDSELVVARSEEMDIASWECYLSGCPDNPLIECLGENVVQAKVHYTGNIFRYLVEDGEIDICENVSIYDINSEIVLFDPETGFSVHDKYAFDYTSYIQLSRNVVIELLSKNVSGISSDKLQALWHKHKSALSTDDYLSGLKVGDKVGLKLK